MEVFNKPWKQYTTKATVRLLTSNLTNHLATSKDLNRLCADNGCSLEDLLKWMNDRDGSEERVRELCGPMLVTEPNVV